MTTNIIELPASRPAPADPRDALLAEAAGFVRASIVAVYDGSALWDHGGCAARQAPRPGTLDQAGLDLVIPGIDLLHGIEAAAGRAADAGPGWLNDLLQGGREP